MPPKKTVEDRIISALSKASPSLTELSPENGLSTAISLCRDLEPASVQTTLIECLFKENGNQSSAIAIIDIAIWLSKENDHHFRYMPLLLIEVLFKSQTVEWCREFWPFLASRREHLGPNPGQKIIRICNALSRRVSRTTDAQFAGQIALYLAMSLPLNEQSGVNKHGQFNDEKISPTLVDEDQEQSQLYSRFFSFQKALTCPKLVAEDVAQFIDNMAFIAKEINFERFKESKAKYMWRWRSDGLAERDSKEDPQDRPEELFIPTFLTEPDTLQMQLKTANTRNVVKWQILIAIDVLTEDPQIFAAGLAPVSLSDRQKSELQKIKESILQVSEIDEVYRLMREREVEWQMWKKAGFPFTPTRPLSTEELKLFDGDSEQLQNARKRKTRFFHPMGTSTLTQLWKCETGVEKWKEPSNIPTAEEYRDRLQSVDGDESAATSISWRGLRIARESMFGGLSKVTRASGYAGIFSEEEEPSVKRAKASLLTAEEDTGKNVPELREELVDRESKPAEKASADTDKTTGSEKEEEANKPEVAMDADNSDQQGNEADETKGENSTEAGEKPINKEESQPTSDEKAEQTTTEPTADVDSIEMRDA